MSANIQETDAAGTVFTELGGKLLTFQLGKQEYGS